MLYFGEGRRISKAKPSQSSHSENANLQPAVCRARRCQEWDGTGAGIAEGRFWRDLGGKISGGTVSSWDNTGAPRVEEPRGASR